MVLNPIEQAALRLGVTVDELLRVRIEVNGRSLTIAQLLDEMSREATPDTP